MKALIKEIKFHKEFESKFGTLFSHKVTYQGNDGEVKTGFYSSKKKEQTFFHIGQEPEFTEEHRDTKGGPMTIIKPVRESNFSNYGRAAKKEQSRYSGFAVSYCKDLIVADKLDIKDWEAASKKVFNWMVALDKSLES